MGEVFSDYHSTSAVFLVMLHVRETLSAREKIGAFTEL